MGFSDRNGAPKSVVGRTFAVLRAFQPGDAELSLAQLTARARLPKPTVYRLAASLVAQGALERVDGGFRLGVTLFELGALARQQADLRDSALPFMEDLYVATHETVHLAVLQGVQILIVEKIAGHRKAPTPSAVGGLGPAYCTGVGKALLAYSPAEVVERVIAAGLRPLTPYTIVVPALLRTELARIGKAGVAYEREESSIGIGCAAAPIFNRNREVIAALSVALPLSRRDLETIAPAVKNAALALSRVVSGWSPPQGR